MIFSNALTLRWPGVNPESPLSSSGGFVERSFVFTTASVESPLSDGIVWFCPLSLVSSYSYSYSYSYSSLRDLVMIMNLVLKGEKHMIKGLKPLVMSYE